MQHASPLWRLVLLLFACLYYRALIDLDIRPLEILERLPDAVGIADYRINLVFAGLCALGLLLALLAPTGKPYLGILGAVLLLLPAWYQGPYAAGPLGARAILRIEIEPLPLLAALLTALWCMVPVRSVPLKWRLCAGAALLGEAALLMKDGFLPIDWYSYVTIASLALCAGLALDWAYAGADLPSALPALVSVARMILLADAPDKRFSLLLSAACAAIGCAYLAISTSQRGRAAGAAVSLLGIAVSSLAILQAHGLLL